jgi:hypothetical protein
MKRGGALLSVLIVGWGCTSAPPPPPAASTPPPKASEAPAKSESTKAPAVASASPSAPVPKAESAQSALAPKTENAPPAPAPKSESAPPSLTAAPVAPKSPPAAASAKAPPKPPVAAAAPKAPAAANPPAASTAPAVANAAPPPAPPAAPLDVKSLEQRLRETKAIGVMTKLSLKNQVDDLLERFRAYHRGALKASLSELRGPYELLLMKVLSLLQDGDPALAKEINASREAIWGVLSDRAKFSQFT